MNTALSVALASIFLAACSAHVPPGETPTGNLAVVRPTEPLLTGVDRPQADRALRLAYAALDRGLAAAGAATESFRAISVTKDELGITTCRFQQQHQGLRVIDHDALVHVSASGQARAGPVDFLEIGALSVGATVSADAAIELVQGDGGGKQRDKSEAITNAGLVVWPHTPAGPVVAYEILVGSRFQREAVYIDAKKGVVAGRRALTMTQQGVF